MKAFVHVAVSIGLLLGGPDLPRATGATQHQSRYIYCNVYLDRVCFGIAGGDSLAMQVPADYTLYTVVLAAGPKAVIYAGRSPQDDVFKSPASKPCATIDRSGKCTYIRSKDNVDILYEADTSSPYVHIHLSGLKPSSERDVQDFLGNFRACKPAGQSAECTDEHLFTDVIP